MVEREPCHDPHWKFVLTKLIGLEVQSATDFDYGSVRLNNLSFLCGRAVGQLDPQIVAIEGDSYRMKEAKEKAVTAAKKSKTKTKSTTTSNKLKDRNA